MRRWPQDGTGDAFVSLNGTDPVTYILSANINRRHMSKGQRAMATVMALRVSGNGTQQQLALVANVSQQRISQANTVAKFAADLTDWVLSGAMSLDDAYSEAKDRKANRDSAETRLAELDKRAPGRPTRVESGLVWRCALR